MDLPWPTITAASGGWILFGALSWTVLRAVLVTGSLVPRREVDVYLKRAETAEKNLERLLEAQAAALPSVAQLRNKIAEAAVETSLERDP